MAFCKNCGGMIRVRVKDASPTREPAHDNLGDCVKVIKDSYEENEVSIEEHTERINSLSTEVSSILNELRGRHSDQHSMLQDRSEQACSWCETLESRIKAIEDTLGKVRIFLKPEEDERLNAEKMSLRISGLEEIVRTLIADNEKAHKYLRAIANAAAYGV